MPVTCPIEWSSTVMWAEMAPKGVDVCDAVLGQAWTPATDRQRIAYDPQTDTLADDVADEIIANIANGLFRSR